MSAHVSVSGASAPYVKPLQDTMMRDPSCASYFTLSTVEHGPRGVTPRARTVVFEGFAVDDDDRFALSCKLSSNSNKFAKRASDEVEICWWFSSARVQFRFRGPMRFETSAQSGSRNALWEQLVLGDRAQFFYPPDVLAKDRQDAVYERATKALIESRGAVPESFCVGLLVPLEVDVLDLNDSSRKYWRRTSVDDTAWEDFSGLAPPVLSVDAIIAASTKES